MPQPMKTGRVATAVAAALLAATPVSEARVTRIIIDATGTVAGQPGDGGRCNPGP